MNILEEIQNCPVEWKELGEVCEIETGKLNANESVEDGKYPFFTTAKEISRINSFRWDTEALLIAGNANVGDVKYYSGKFEAYQRTYVLTNFSNNLKARFLLHIIKQGLKSYLENNTNKAAMSYIVISTLKSFPIPIPPLEIQEKIVQTLDKMTEYVTELTSELTSRKKQYSFYRDKLLSFEDEVYQVEWKELGGVVFTLTSPVKLAKKQYQLTGRIPIVDQGEQFIAGYTDNEKYLEKDEYIIFGDHSEHIKFVDFAFVQGADGLKILKPNKGINAKYLYYCVCNFYEKEGSYKRHWSHAKITLIPIPPLKIQEKVVQILDNFDKVCSDLNIGLPKEIELRQKQYEYWREQLLNFNK